MRTYDCTCAFILIKSKFKINANARWLTEGQQISKSPFTSLYRHHHRTSWKGNFTSCLLRFFFLFVVFFLIRCDWIELNWKFHSKSLWHPHILSVCVMTSHKNGSIGVFLRAFPALASSSNWFLMVDFGQNSCLTNVVVMFVHLIRFVSVLLTLHWNFKWIKIICILVFLNMMNREGQFEGNEKVNNGCSSDF